jgi:hypothetical protein
MKIKLYILKLICIPLISYNIDDNDLEKEIDSNRINFESITNKSIKDEDRDNKECLNKCFDSVKARMDIVSDVDLISLFEFEKACRDTLNKGINLNNCVKNNKIIAMFPDLFAYKKALISKPIKKEYNNSLSKLMEIRIKNNVLVSNSCKNLELLQEFVHQKVQECLCNDKIFFKQQTKFCLLNEMHFYSKEILQYYLDRLVKSEIKSEVKDDAILLLKALKEDSLFIQEIESNCVEKFLNNGVKS